jgi:predicted GNAT family acetyltransferase
VTEPLRWFFTYRCPEVDEFLERAGAFLEAREAQHNLIFGICSTLRQDPNAYGAPPYLAVVNLLPDDRVVAAAVRTPPFPLVLSEIDEIEAVRGLASAVHEEDPDLPGVMGPVGVVESFVEAWRELTGRPGTESIRQGIFRCDRVQVPIGVPGSARRAGEADRDLLVRWIDEFAREALGDHPRQDPEDDVARRLRGGDDALWLWEDGRPVSLAGHMGPTPHGIRIGPVYTPPDLRGRGYAGALVGEVTRRLLDDERFRFCFLFTDLSNPIANRLYERLGYRRVGGTVTYRFD